MSPNNAQLLQELIKNELSTVPLENWRYFFPCSVAVWRFIELQFPGVFGPLQAGFDTEPFFIGKGAKWFCDVLQNDEEYLDLLESIMYEVVRKLGKHSKERGFLIKAETPELNGETINQLAQVIASKLEEGIKSSQIE